MFLFEISFLKLYLLNGSIITLDRVFMENLNKIWNIGRKEFIITYLNTDFFICNSISVILCFNVRTNIREHPIILHVICNNAEQMFLKGRIEIYREKKKKGGRGKIDKFRFFISSFPNE